MTTPAAPTNRAAPRAGARVARALAALTALLAVIVGVPLVLAVIGAVPHHLPTAQDIGQSLTSRDDSGLYFRVLGAAAVWVAWAVFTLATLREVAASIRFRGPRPALPHGTVGRLAPAALVAAIAVLFVAAPATLLVTAPPSAAQPPVGSSATLHPGGAGRTGTEQVAAGTSAPAAATVLPTYRVRRYDTLWSIAQRHLPGDPARRYKDIRQLNPDTVGPDNQIDTGAVLTLPPDARDLPTTTGDHLVEEVPVHAGDTLSGIAAAHGVSDWPRIWPLNAEHPEPGHQRFTDPDHIEPGWTVAVPRGRSTPTAPSSPPTVPPRPTPTDAPPQQNPPPHPDAPTEPTTPTSTMPTSTMPTTARPTEAPGTATTVQSAAASPSGGSTSPKPSDHGGHRGATDAWDFVFAGGATMLAAGIFTTLRAARRRQGGARTPGRTIRPTPPELIPAERAVLTHGPAAVADVTFVDHALRSLSAATATDAQARLPEVIAARLTGDHLDLRIATAHRVAPPDPWTVDESGWWSISTAAELRVDDDTAHRYLAPYPTLVTIGHDPTGTAWLLDLEAAGALALGGDPDRCLNLARFIAAELAVNVWSADVAVTLVGFGAEMVPLNPDRLRHSTDLDTAATALTAELRDAREASRAAGTDILTGRMRAIAGDSWLPHVLLIAPPTPQSGQATGELEQLLAAVGEQAGRSTVAVVLAGAQSSARPTARQIQVSADGRLTIPDLDADLTAEQLPAEQVAALARLLDKTAETGDAAVPACTAAAPYGRYIDAVGALLPEVTSPRPVADDPDDSDRTSTSDPGTRTQDPTAPTDNEDAGTSVLPGADADYLRVGAARAEELQALAPRVTADRREEVIAADPALDAELADWLDPDSATPKLTLLGPVHLHAGGERPPKRISYHTEVAAFLATREHGATAEQVAAAFDVATTSIYSRINTVRAWLGTNPRTGHKYLPDSTQSDAGKARGVGVYQLAGVLVDAGLFTRLRCRALALGGPHGLAYLQAALDLVTGAPFEQLREGGYGWLAETPLDHHLVVAIVDTAHTAHLEYLRTGDLPKARAAAETALHAAPYEDIPRLDLAAVMKAEGLDHEADRYLRDEICNRSDNGQAPDDLPERTAEILRRRAWLSHAT